MSTSRRYGPTVSVLVAAVFAGGCGASQQAGTPVGSSAPAAEPSSAPTTTTTTTTTPPPPPPPTAADGADYAACADGNCEVSIAEPVRIKLKRGSRLSVTSVNADGIDIDLSLGSGGGGTGTLKGSCGAIFTFSSSGGGAGTFCRADGVPPPPPEPAPGEVALQFMGMNGGAGVLRVVSG